MRKGKNGGFRCFVLLVLLAVMSLSFGGIGDASQETADSDVVDRAMGHGDAADIIVARVNGVTVNMASLMGRMLDISEARYGRREITSILAEKIKQESLGQLVTEELAYQAAVKVVQVTPVEVKEVVEARIKSFGGEKDFLKYLKAKQLKNKMEFSEQIRHFLVIQKYISEYIESKIEINDEMIAVAYRESAGAYFNKPELVQVSKITFFLDPSHTDTYDKIKKVRSKMINELSGDLSKLEVDGTFIVQENIKLNDVADKKLYDVAKELGEFEISDVVESNGTLHLLQLTGYQAPVSKSLPEVRGYLKNELSDRVKQTMLKEWMESLHKGADVEIIKLIQ